MTLFKVVLRAYHGYTKPYLPSTTIAGGIVHGMIINKSLEDVDIAFSNFVAKDYKHVYLGRIQLHRLGNKTYPFLYEKIIKKGENYTEFEGYARAKDEEQLKKILSTYSYYIGNVFTLFELDRVEKVEEEINNLCVNNLLVNEILTNKIKFSKLEVKLLRFQNYNYFNHGELKLNYIAYFPYYYDLNKEMFNENIKKEKILYLMTFDVNKERFNDDNFWYYKKESLNQINDLASKLYIKMGTGAITPCAKNI